MIKENRKTIKKKRKCCSRPTFGVYFKILEGNKSFPEDRRNLWIFPIIRLKHIFGLRASLARPAIDRGERYTSVYQRPTFNSLVL